MSDTFDHEADAWGQFDDWLTGGAFDEPGGYRYGKRNLTCRLCGRGGSEWGRVDGRWALVDQVTKRPHRLTCTAEKF